LTNLKSLAREFCDDDAEKLLAVDLLIRLGFNEKAARLFVVILGTIFLTRAPQFLEKVMVQRPDWGNCGNKKPGGFSHGF
jgi:hypothetical protein